MLGQVIDGLLLVLNVFLGLLFVRLVVDWVQVFARSWSPEGPVLVCSRSSTRHRPADHVRPPRSCRRCGSAPWCSTLSFLIVLVVVYLLQILVGNIFF